MRRAKLHSTPYVPRMGVSRGRRKLSVDAAAGRADFLGAAVGRDYLLIRWSGMVIPFREPKRMVASVFPTR